MKVQCVKNTFETGLFTKKINKVDLTLGKVYDVQVIPLVNGYLEGTHIDFSDLKFLVYNDKDEWSSYDLTFFKPYSEK